MQAVVVAFRVLEKQWRWPLLACVMASLDELFMVVRIANPDSHRGIPAVRDRRKLSVKRFTKALDEAGERVVEVFILAASEAVPSHDDAAAEYGLLRIQSGESPAFVGRENALKQSATLLVQILPDLLPIECVDTGDRLISEDGAMTLFFVIVASSTKRVFMLVPLFE